MISTTSFLKVAYLLKQCSPHFFKPAELLVRVNPHVGRIGVRVWEVPEFPPVGYQYKNKLITNENVTLLSVTKYQHIIIRYEYERELIMVSI